jgi:hypothetical protein
MRGRGDPQLAEETRKARRDGVTFPRMAPMHAEIRCDMEDARPAGGAREDHRSSCVMGALDRGARVQVQELHRSEELAVGQAYDVAHLAECAGAPGLFDAKRAFQLTLQGSIVSVDVRVGSGFREPPDDSGSAPEMDQEMEADSGECDAEKNEDQGITFHRIYTSPPNPIERALARRVGAQLPGLRTGPRSKPSCPWIRACHVEYLGGSGSHRDPSLADTAKTDTGIPLSTAVPATWSTFEGSVRAFAFTPGRRLATDRRSPRPPCP